MRNLLILVFILGQMGIVDAQISYADAGINRANSGSMYTDRYELRKEYNKKFVDQIKETAVFDWHDAIVTFGNKSSEVIARYNPIDDSVEIKDGDDIRILAKRNNTRVKLTSKDVEYVVKFYYGADNKIYSSYFIEDKSTKDPLLLRKEHYETFRAKQYSSYQPANFRFLKTDTFYLIAENNKLYQLTTNKKVIKENYPENANLIIDFIKENKLKSNKDKDIVTLATYINTL